jgi:hypothetical protein
MKLKLFGSFLLFGIVILFFLFLPKSVPAIAESEGEEDENKMQVERMLYEFDLVKDPSGKIPEGIREQEMALARSMPVKETEIFSTNSSSRTSNLNTYLPAGPNNTGGRTRAIAYDINYASTNVIIAGSVSGGIMRSSNGGTSWALVTPPEDVHSFTAIAQDPRPGSQNIWYAGGGEYIGNSASGIGATYLGHGLWKSTNNGVSWTKLTFAINDFPGNAQGNALEAFDHPFDFVHRIAVNPTNGHVFIAAHRRVVRTTDGGNSFEAVFGSNVASTASTGQNDVAISSDGRIFVAMNGGNPDQSLRGVHISTSGNRGTFQRIAGGQTLGVDSIPDWRANSYPITSSEPKRIIMTLAPSNNKIGYIFYENGLSQAPPDLKPEGDLFRFTDETNSFTWSNRSANMPDFPGGNFTDIDPLALQGGYNMVVKVHPTNVDIVFVGGVNLYRSTDGFTSNTNTAWINGYRQSPLDAGLYMQNQSGVVSRLSEFGHPDIHELVFNPANSNEAICGDDGGVRRTSNILAGGNNWPVHPVQWNFLMNYQTVQYYYVAMDPDAGRNMFTGGAQDHGTLLRDKLGYFVPLADSNNHVRIFGGDGTSVGVSKLTSGTQFIYAAPQFGGIRRIRLVPSYQAVDIRPENLTGSPDDPSSFGEFVTRFSLNPDNTEDLYYANFNRLFRSVAASNASQTNFTELTGVGQAINPASPSGTNIRIRAMAFTRGPYNSSHVMYIGTTPVSNSSGQIVTPGKIFRLNDPRNALPATVPVDITPTGSQGNIQDIAVNPNNDDEILAIATNYGVISIWHTTNAKSAVPTWRNVEGNLALPSIRSCVIAVKKDAANQPVTEYYVGTSIGLYSTTNISGSPTWVREGGQTLNYAVVGTMTYRPVDNVMLVGTHGNGMYYTYLGTPNFTPINTSINPITNDSRFITSVYPTITTNTVFYSIGDLFTINRLRIDVTGLNGQRVYQKESPYQNGRVDLGHLPSGAYIISIYSLDGKYRHIQKVIKR